jgi:hypothetical protein
VGTDVEKAVRQSTMIHFTQCPLEPYAAVVTTDHHDSSQSRIGMFDPQLADSSMLYRNFFSFEDHWVFTFGL